METKTRSLLKALSWRVIASFITASLVFCFTGRSLLAVGVGICDSLVKIVAYFAHERVWMLVRFGLWNHPLQALNVRKPLTAKDEQAIRQKLSELGYLRD